MKITLQKQIDELKRELGFRKKLYPRWISNKNIREDVAKYQIEALEAAIQSLEALKPPQGAQEKLF
jgi:hypothetical protein